MNCTVVVGGVTCLWTRVFLQDVSLGIESLQQPCSALSYTVASRMPLRGLLHLISGSRLGGWNVSAPRGAGRRGRMAASPQGSDDAAVTADTAPPARYLPSASYPVGTLLRSFHPSETPRGRRCHQLHIRDEETS